MKPATNLPLYQYNGELIRTVDGDTVILRLTRIFTTTLDLGFHVKTTLSHTGVVEQSFRLLGIDTPEMVGTHKVAGQAAKDALDALLKEKPLYVTSHKSDKYGRWLCEIDVLQPDGSVLNASKYLLEHGFAKPYDGQGPRS